jgi:hypothetical protein
MERPLRLSKATTRSRTPFTVLSSHRPIRRRFPPPWPIEEANNACFIVRDGTGQALAYVYFEDEPGRRSAAKLLTRDEARRIAANIAKLPEPLGALKP